MKIYPHKASRHREHDGFTADEINRGEHWLRTDVQCTVCKHILPLAVAGSTDNGKCNRCGGKNCQRAEIEYNDETTQKEGADEQH